MSSSLLTRDVADGAFYRNCQAWAFFFSQNYDACLESFNALFDFEACLTEARLPLISGSQNHLETIFFKE